MRAGEGPIVLLMALNVFLLLVAYYVLKTVREPLILASGGAELKSYASAFQALTLIGYVPLYGWVASRLPRQRFLMAVVLFFVGCIQLFFVGSRLGVPYLGFVFFVWVGIFSLTTIAQFWSYANEIYSRPEGNRLFPLIAVGSAAGAPFGAAIAERLFKLGINPYVMMEIAAGLLLLHLGLYRVVNRRVSAGPAKAEQEPMKEGNGFAMVFQSRYLGLDRAAPRAPEPREHGGRVHPRTRRRRRPRTRRSAAQAAGFDKEAFIGAFYGNYFLWTNLATIAHPGLRRVADRQALRHEGGPAGASDRVALRVQHGRRGRGALRPPVREDRRELDRLLGQQHGQADAVAPHEPRGEVQGQAGDRHLLRSLRRHARRRGRLRGDAPASREASRVSRAPTS